MKGIIKVIHRDYKKDRYWGFIESQEDVNRDNNGSSLRIGFHVYSFTHPENIDYDHVYTRGYRKDKDYWIICFNAWQGHNLEEYFKLESAE